MSQRNPNAPSGIGRPFIIVAVLLFAAAVAFNTEAWRLKLVFKKDAMEQRLPFESLPPLMGHWLQISLDEKLDKELQDSLGTDKYIYRNYVQVEQYGAEIIEALKIDEKADSQTKAQQRSKIEAAFAAARTLPDKVKMVNAELADKSASERQIALARVETTHLNSVIHLGLTYYTGLVDTVPHIPDRCYIADGYNPSERDTPIWTLGKDSSGKDQPKMEVRLMHFEDQTANNRVAKNVAYVFNVNGHYESDPTNVRIALQDLTIRKSYFAKIELMQIGSDSQPSAVAMADFLSAAKEPVEACLPDWSNVERGSK